MICRKTKGVSLVYGRAKRQMSFVSVTDGGGEMA